MTNRIEVTEGMKFGRLTVVREGPQLILPCGQKNRTAECICDCGAMKIVRLVHLTRHKTTSCGCGNGVPHNEKKEPLYIKWRAINYRCHGIKHDNYCTRKGLSVCEEWRNSYIKFKIWAYANGYKDGLHIDRIDNSQGYSPENCRFVTNIQNVNNRDNTFYIKYRGQKRSFMEVIHDKRLWLNMAAIRGRIKRGWDADSAIDTPIREGRYFRNTFSVEDAMRKMEIKNLRN